MLEAQSQAVHNQPSVSDNDTSTEISNEEACTFVKTTDSSTQTDLETYISPSQTPSADIWWSIHT